MLRKFKFLRSHLDIRHLRMLYISLVQPHLSYGNVAWGATYDSHLAQVLVIQKWLLRVIYNKIPTFPSDELFRISDVLDVRQLYCMKLLGQVYTNKITIDQVDHSHFTRKRDTTFKRTRCRKSIGQRCSSYLAPRIYGVFPVGHRTLRPMYKFKRAARLWILSVGRRVISDFINQC